MKLQIFLWTCTPISELPSNISTMVYSDKEFNAHWSNFSGSYWVTQKLPQIYSANQATFPIRKRKITVHICGILLGHPVYLHEEETFCKAHICVQFAKCIKSATCSVLSIDIVLRTREIACVRELAKNSTGWDKKCFLAVRMYHRIVNL